MLSLAPAATAVAAPTQLEIHRLGGSVFLLCWTLDAAPFGKPTITLAGGGRRLAAASVLLGLRDGRERLAVAFRASGHESIVATLSDHGPQGDVTAAFDPGLVHGLADPVALLQELTPQARLTLANALVGAWPSLFGLAAIPNYLSFLRQLLLALTPKPVAIQPAASLVEGRWLCETAVPGDFTALRSAARLDSAGLTRLDLASRVGAPDRGGKRELHLVLDAPPVRGGLLILQAERSLVVRSLPVRQAAPSLGRWWAGKAASRDGLRNWVVEQLSGLSERGRLLAVEMQRRVPLAVQHVRRNDDLPAAELDLAVCNRAGLLIGGWLRDPDDLLDEVLLHRGSGEPIAMLAGLQRFPVRLPSGTEGETRPATGFAAFASDYASGAPVLQPRCEIKLRSGTTLTLRPPVQPADAATIRARALTAIPPQYLTAAMIETTLAPILAACQEDLRENRADPVVTTFGRAPARPRASVVIPLYRVYDFLRVQVAAFAGDPWFVENAELVYVLDSPEHEAEVAHLLGGLHLAYGLPMQLVQRLDIAHPLYNPRGSLPGIEVRFGFANGSFDFITMTSVATHLPPDELVVYLQEASRLLAPGGRLFLTAFAIDGSATGQERLSFKRWQDGPGWYAIDEAPLAAAGIDSSFLLEQATQAGLAVEVLRPGHWRGISAAHYQDLLIATKPGGRA
ncbi:hypothetical protein BTHI11S_05404 [Bosea thiooxidans]